MSVFDLIFICLFLAIVSAGCAILYNLLCRRRQVALRISYTTGIGLAVYLVIVALVAVATPQTILARGQNRCFDEMCFAVTDVKDAPAIGEGLKRTMAGGKFYLVTVRASSHSRGRAQSEAGVGVSLLDSKGRRYEISSAGQRAYESANGSNPPLTTRLRPGESVLSVQVFDVPLAASDLALHFDHSGPGLFIIGDDGSLLHKPTVIRLNP